MRDIEFRGKHTHALSSNEHLDGTWVYGLLCGKGCYIEPSDGNWKIIEAFTKANEMRSLMQKKIEEGAKADAM